ncbi:MAG: hypothetical protein ACKVOR_11465 [Flavobacteriales bacterium]
MRIITTLICVCVLINNVRAQEDNSFHELGLNATPFINQYLDFGDDDDELISPFTLTYERRFGIWGMRFGMGLLSSTDLQKADDDQTEPSIRFSNTTMAARAGAVRYIELSKKFSLKYGMDAFFIYDTEKSVTTVNTLFGNEQKTTISTLTWESGLSPFLFVQFHLTNNFSLGTELLGKASYISTVEKEEDSQFPDFNDRQETVGNRFTISAPTSLFFILRF